MRCSTFGSTGPRSCPRWSPLFVAAFSLADRPAPATTRARADAFDAARRSATARGRRATRSTSSPRTFPDRRRGLRRATRGWPTASRDVSGGGSGHAPARLRGQRSTTEWRRRGPGDGRRRAARACRAAGSSSSRRATRAATRPRRALGTAALLELARISASASCARRSCSSPPPARTTGFAGARAWAREAAAHGRRPVDAVLVLGDLAGERIRKPWVVPWSTSGAPAPLALQRTVESALRAEVAPQPGRRPRARGQWIRRALPLTISEQGVVAAPGCPPSRRRDRRARPRPPTSRSRARAWASFGRGLLRAVTAIDEAGPTDPERAAARPPSPAGRTGSSRCATCCPTGRCGCSIGTLLLPALLAALDGLFRARRRRLPVGRWAALGRRRRAAAPLLAWLWLRALGADRRARRPGRARGAGPLPVRDRPAIVALVSTALVARRRLVRPAPADRRAARAGRERGRGRRWPPPPGSSSTCSPRVVWVFNPYAAALLLPAAHLWLFAAAPGSRLRGPWAALPVALGVALPLLAPSHYVAALDLDPLVARAGCSRSRPPTATSRSPPRSWSRCWLACLAGLLVVLRVRARSQATAEPERLRTRGPAGYAGPGLARRHRVGAARDEAPRCARSRRVLIVVGALLLADAVVTLLWQEPLSALYGRIQQGSSRTASRRSSRRRWPPSTSARCSGCDAEPPAARSRRARSTARSERGRSARAHPDPADRRLGGVRRGHGHGRPAHGPGHYPATPLPGQRGTVGDRRPPHDLRRAVPRRRRARAAATDRAARCPTGASPTGSSARGSSPPTATWVTDRVGYDRLVLSACHPLYSAAQRIVVFARLEQRRGPRTAPPDDGVPELERVDTPSSIRRA